MTMKLPRAIHVLLVEDNLYDAQRVTHALATTETAFDVSHVGNLGEALERLDEERFDIILTDLSLPDSTPYETVTRLRGYAPSAPMIVLTSMSDKDLAHAAIEQGAQDFLSKDELIPLCLERSIDYAMKRHDSRQQIERLLVDVEGARQSLERKNICLAELYETAQKFVDNVSHEFRTPLSVIKEYVALIQEGLAGEINERQCRMLSVVADRSDDLNRMVDDMLDVSRLGSGMLHIWRENHSPADIVAHILPALKTKAELRKVELEVDVSEALPDIFCDADKIGRALTNLAVNAIKFCGTPGRVAIALRNNPGDGSVVFSVSDNGDGLDKSQLQVIFDRFKQLDNNLRGSTKGFGLGLSIAKELILLNLGDIDVSSELGVGSMFSFSVPVANTQEILRRYVELSGQSNAGIMITVLVASSENCHTVSQRGELDALINYLLRGSDLSVALSPTSWIIMAQSTPADAQTLIARYADAWAEANRNRPGAELPALKLSIVGAWQAPDDQEALLEAIEQLAGESSLLPA